MGRALIVIGIALVIVGLLLTAGEKLPIRLGRLPGDIVWKKGSFSFYFPLATCLIVSLVVSLIIYLVRK